MCQEGETSVPRTVERNETLIQTSEDRLDARLILVMRGLRQLAYGLLAVLLGVALAEEGFSPFAIGTLITVSLIGDVVGTLVIGATADIWGRRRMLAPSAQRRAR
jgi:MFS family permease